MKRWIVIFAGVCVFCTYMLSSCGGAFLNSTSLFSSLPSVEGESNNIPSKDFFYIKISEAYYRGTHGFDLLDYEMYESINGPGYDCKISVNEESSTADMYCMFDVLEGDLFFHKLEFEYNAPPGMCDFVFLQTHWHYNRKAGYGPKNVFKKSFPKLSSALDHWCTNPPTGMCLAYTSEYEAADCSTEDPGDGSKTKTKCYLSEDVRYCEFPSDTLESCKENAEDVCERYNKTNIEEEGANCCIGDYDLYDAENPDGDPEREDIPWGGDLRQCIGGLGRFATDEIGYSPDGFPSILIENSKAGLRKTYSVPAIIDSLVTKYKDTESERKFHPKQRSFITANYWTGIEDGTDTPRFYKADPDPPYYGRKHLQDGYPYITLSCKDQAYEIKHRIHLIIREWNSQEEFRDFKDSQGNNGDSDVVGEAGGDCDYYEQDEDYKLEDRQCNDMQDADDWTATSEDYPKLDYSK